MKKSILNKCIIPIITLIIFSTCSTSQKTQTEIIFKPDFSYRSPNLDFTKVERAAILPINCSSNEIPEITNLINDNISRSLESAQKAWKFYSPTEILIKINEAGLGRGYQNYIADLNTFTTVAGMTPNFTAETHEFFEKLSNLMNFQALIFTNYIYSEKVVQEWDAVAALLSSKNPYVNKKKKVLTVWCVLYDLKSKRTWWTSKLSLEAYEEVSNSELTRKVIEGISNNFGKGDLRQL